MFNYNNNPLTDRNNTNSFKTSSNMQVSLSIEEAYSIINGKIPNTVREKIEASIRQLQNYNR